MRLYEYLLFLFEFLNDEGKIRKDFCFCYHYSVVVIRDSIQVENVIAI